MKFLIVQETDWITRGPHLQQHIFERLSLNPKNQISVFDYDIDHLTKSQTIYQPKKIYTNITRVIKDSKIKIIRPNLIAVPFIRRASSILSFIYELFLEIKTNRPDFIINYSMSNGFIALIFARLFKIRFIFHYIDIIHELVPIPFIRKFAQIIEEFILKKSDLVLVLNQIHKKYILSRGIKKEKCIVLRTGISLWNTKINSEKIRQIKDQYKLSDDDFIIFFMGFLYDFANLPKIIDYYDTKVKNGSMKMKFLLLGDGGIVQNLKEQIAAKDSNWVIMTGKVPYTELANYIELANLCLQSFDLNKITREISPIKIYEYMAQKKPVISTRLPGIYHEIGENNGIMFVDSPDQLIRDIEKYYSQRSLLNDLGKKGYEFVKHLDWEIIISDFRKILHKLLKN